MLGIHVIYTMKPGKRDAFLAEIAACKVAAAALVAEQGIASKQHVTDAQAAGTRSMTGRVQPGNSQAADLNLGALLG